MKASLYHVMRYIAPDAVRPEWPVPPAPYDVGVGKRSFEESMEQSLLADELGFDWISLSEHHYMHSTMSPTPMLIGSYLASRLRHAKIAMLGPTMPLNNPVRVAEELAMLDNLTDGRLVVGLLRGTPNEYQVYGANPAETRDMTIEGMELVIKALTEPQPFGWQGRYFQYRTVSVWPRPVQQPHPPVFVLGTSPETGEFAARHHFGLGVSFDRFDLFAKTTAYYRERCREAGWEPTPDDIIYRGRIYVADTDEQAADDIKRYWETAGRPMRSNVAEAVGSQDPNPRSPSTGYGSLERRPRVNFFGSPATVIKQIEQCRDEMGAGIIDVSFQGPGLLQHKMVMRSIELFGKEVLPCIREL